MQERICGTRCVTYAGCVPPSASRRKRTGAPYENLIFDRRSSGREDLSTSSDDGKNPNARPDFVNGYDRAFLQICQAVRLPFLLLATPRSGAPEERLHAPGRGTRPAPPL